MKTTTKVAFANLKQNKGRNLICGVAILLTTFLVFVVLTVGFGSICAQYAAVNAYYPTWHMLYRDVPADTLNQLKLHEDIEEIGCREDFGGIETEQSNATLISMDEEGLKLNKMELEEGHFPKEKNEIMLPKWGLEKLGIEGKIGDTVSISYQPYEGKGLGLPMEEKFVITGFAKQEETSENPMFAIVTTEEYMESVIPKEERLYRVMVRLATRSGATTDQIEEEGKEIASNFKIPEANIRVNTDYLAANYVDPAFVSGIFVIVLVILFAGILTIYSIYYVSTIPKVQEYGKLKALGVTKHQMKQIVFREGMLVALVAIPIGLLISTAASQGIIRLMFFNLKGGNALATLQLQMLKDGKVDIFQTWIYLVTVLVAMLTVAISLSKPMRMATKISPVEAMRYDGELKGKRKHRKGYESLNLFRLTNANLSRNKKRTAITILTLSATGILYMVLATVLSCCNPKEMAKVDLAVDYRIQIDSEEYNQLHPEYKWSEIQKNNPIDDAFVQEVRDTPGVTKVNLKSGIYATLPDYIYPQDDGPWITRIVGLDDSYEEVLKKYLIQGKVSYRELQKGNQIILSKTFLHWFPEVKVGDTVKMEIERGEGIEERSFEIAAIVDYPRGITDADFVLPKEVIDSMSSNHLDYYCDIDVDESQKTETYKKLDELAASKERLTTTSYEKYVEEWKNAMEFMSIGFYAFLFIMGGICMMNLINTMISSIHTRRRELGMMQAIGMSDQQLVRHLQLEGLFYTAGTLLIALGVGSIAGYGVFLYARAEHMMNIKYYHYPWLQAACLVVIVTLIQLLLTYVTSRNFQKHTLIERVRYSE